MKTKKRVIVVMLVILLSFNFLAATEKVNFSTNDDNFNIKYQEFLDAQKQPLLSAGEELFLLNNQIWQRHYGEKEFYLSPAMTDLERKEYDFRITQLDDKENGIKKSQFHFVKVKITPLSISLLSKMSIKVPSYIKNTANVFLPEIDIDELHKNNIELDIVENYGNESGNYIAVDDKSKATIWSNNFEGAFPTSDYSAGDSNSNNGSDYWDDVSEDKYEGSRSLWCADIGDQPNCGNYDDNMDAYVTFTSGINVSSYTDVQFSYALKYNMEVNYDYLYRYYSTNGTSWTQSTTVYNGNSNGWSVKAFNITGFTNYYWKFRFTSDGSVHNFYGASIDIVKLTGNQAGLGAPVKINPTNNATLTTTTPAFSVQTVSGATNYGWWIKENGNVVIDPWNNGGWTSGTSFTPASGILQSGHNYTWDCRAYNADGWGEESSVYWAFSITSPNAKWTLMVYLNGDNNLEAATVSDLNKMESANDSDDINVIVQIDRIPGHHVTDPDWTTTRRYKVKHDNDTSVIGSTLIQDMGELNMGDPQTLADFGKWAVQNYPADNYMLMLYDHGNGWYKDGEEEGITKGISWDDTSGGSNIGVANGEFGNALSQIKNEIGVKIGLLAMDACLMQMWEVMDVARNYVDYMEASEEIGWTNSTDYKDIINGLISDPNKTSRNLAILVEQQCSERTNSAVDLAKISTLSSRIDTFADKLIQARGEGYTSEIESARDSSFEMEEDHGYECHIDLGHFACKIAQKNVPQYLKDAANNVRNYMMSDVVISKHFRHFENHQNLWYDNECEGIAIYHPEDHNNYNANYNNLAIATSTNWDEYISTEGSTAGTSFTDGFESGFGNWVNASGDNFDWTRKSGSTSSSSTGPSSAHSGSYYIYTESSSPNYPTKTAIVEGPSINFSAGLQIDFWYHMYGSSMGTLYLEENTSGSWVTLWSKAGDQGNSWKNQTVSLSGLSGVGKLRFRGVTANSYRSDMALDDIVIDEEQSVSYNDGFETNFGNWPNASGDNFDWTRKSGSTSSSSTGPSSAHSGSYYIYTESSSPNYPTKTAIVEGPSINFSAGLQIDFWYHMYGSSMGTLYLEENTSGSWVTLWSKSGDQGNSWKNQTVSLSGLSGSGKLRFRGVTANSYRSDMALDDIAISGAKKGEESIENLEETPDVTVSYFLSANYPNPFNPTTTISFSLPAASSVSLNVYNIKGQLVKTLVNEQKESGNHSVVWNGRDNSEKQVSSGVYFYRIDAGEFADMKKMILIK